MLNVNGMGDPMSKNFRSDPRLLTRAPITRSRNPVQYVDPKSKATAEAPSSSMLSWMYLKVPPNVK